ncbi:MAG: DUF368 domain-containing protein [Bacteroidales bacterium]|nr:DUF368 domain-containing protein [Bacteroidales bacterium]
MKRNAKDYIQLGLKGIAMGAANVIPGVSGGTIAFITGIMKELVDSVNAIDLKAIKLLFTGHFKSFWNKIHGGFLLTVCLGILISTFSLASLMKNLLANHPVQTWAFFFGLIIASCYLILKEVKDWKINDILWLVIGVAFGVIVCRLTPTKTPDGLWFIFITGAIAICAMVLPGLSGSFIMVILGKYEYIMEAISTFNIPVLLAFGLGVVVGMISFCKVMSFLLDKYYRQTLVTMAGFILGSLIKVWPWQNGAEVTHVFGAIVFMILGVALVAGIETARIIEKSKTES